MKFREIVTSSGTLIAGLGIGIADDATLPLVLVGGAVVVVSRVVRRKKKPSKLQVIRSAVVEKVSPQTSIQRNVFDVKMLYLRQYKTMTSDVSSRVRKLVNIAGEIYKRPLPDVEMDFRRQSLLMNYLPTALRSYAHMSVQDRVSNKEKFVLQLDTLLREAEAIRQSLYDQAALESGTMDIFLQEKFPEPKPSSLDYK